LYNLQEWDADLDWERFDVRVGDASATHVGLKSRVTALGYPDGYDLALHWLVLERLAAVCRAYGLGKVASIPSDSGTYIQPVEYSKLEAVFIARELRWLPKVSVDPVILRAAEPLADLAERCRSSQSRSEKLLFRFL
jgi:hypothetical protein